MLVGPWVAALCLTVVLVVQALVAADGGLTALGLNVTNMALVSTLVAYLVIAALLRVLPRAWRGRLAVTGPWQAGKSISLEQVLAATHEFGAVSPSLPASRSASRRRAAEWSSHSRYAELDRMPNAPDQYRLGQWPATSTPTARAATTALNVRNPYARSPPRSRASAIAASAIASSSRHSANGSTASTRTGPGTPGPHGTWSTATQVWPITAPAAATP